MKYREVNLVGGFYKDASLPWSSQDCVNWLPAGDDSGQARSEMMLRGAPGLFGIEIEVSPLRIAGSLPSAQRGIPYSAQFFGFGGSPPYFFTVASGSLPPGLEFDGQSGVISGTPSFGGSFPFTVQVEDSEGGTAASFVTLQIASNSSEGGGGVVPDPDPTPTPSASGAIFGGYVGVPHFQNAVGGEGFTFSTPPSRVAWQSNASTGMPENVGWASCFVCGTPTTAGSYSWETKVNYSGSFTLIDLSGSFTVAASPANTVLNSADREINAQSVKFETGPAPWLRVKGGFQWAGASGFVRALNGYTTGKRYWEVTVNDLPADTSTESQITVGIDRSQYGLVSYGSSGEYTGAISYPNTGGFDSTRAGYGITSRRLAGDATYQGFQVLGWNGPAVNAPMLANGNVLSFAHDADGGKLWVAVNGAWIGGGNPATDTAPTLSGLTFEAASRFNQWKPYAYVSGGVQLTFNFGDQAFAHSAPAGFSTVAFGRLAEFNRQILASDTMDTRGVPGSERGVFVLSRDGAGGIIYSPERYAVGVQAREGADVGGQLPTIRGDIGKTSGKWQIELGGYSFGDFAAVGLAPFDWVQSVGGGPGYTSDSFGAFPRGTSSPTAEIVLGGAVVATPAQGGIYTLAVDLDASPKTVRVLRDGVTVGTYNLPATGRPWVPVLCYAGTGYSQIRLDTLRYPQAGFNDWTAMP